MDPGIAQIVASLITAAATIGAIVWAEHGRRRRRNGNGNGRDGDS